MKSVETMANGWTLEERLAEPTGRARGGGRRWAGRARRRCGTSRAARAATARRGAAGRARRDAVTSPRSSSSRAMRSASTVLPMPTSSAMSSADGIEPERHQQRDELVRPRLDGDAAEGAERAGARAEAEPEGVAEQAGRAVVAEIRRPSAERSAGGRTCSERRVDARRSRRRCRRAGGGRGGPSSDSGRTTHSRPRARTSEPTAKLMRGSGAEDARDIAGRSPPTRLRVVPEADDEVAEVLQARSAAPRSRAARSGNRGAGRRRSTASMSLA